jgi:hypothetical protein
VARQLQWLSADGQQLLTLTDQASGYRVLDQTTGLNAPPYRIATDTYAGIDGVTVQAVSAAAREVMLALMIQAPSWREPDPRPFRQRIAALTRAMRPKAGPGTLISADEYGRTRKLRCYYTSGLEGSGARGEKLGDLWWKTTVHLLADDPWWYGDKKTVDVGLGAGANFFPIFPLVLAPSTVQGQFTIDLSDADDRSYPVWTITGPGSNLVLTNQTTGQTIEVTASLSAGQQMIIDTRPGYQSVRRDDGTNLMGSVTSDPALWSLPEQINQVSAALTGATTASRIHGEYQPRYAGV